MGALRFGVQNGAQARLCPAKENTDFPFRRQAFLGHPSNPNDSATQDSALLAREADRLTFSRVLSAGASGPTYEAASLPTFFAPLCSSATTARPISDVEIWLCPARTRSAVR